MSKGTAQGSAHGPKKIFGRENINWSGPKKAHENSSAKSDASSAKQDFSSSSSAQDIDKSIYESIKDSYIEGAGASEVKNFVVEWSVNEYMLNTAQMLDEEDVLDLSWEYQDKFDEFSQTEEGSRALYEEISQGLDNYDLINMDISREDETYSNSKEVDKWINENGFDTSYNAFQKYLLSQSHDKEEKEAFDSLVNDDAPYIDDDFYDELERAQEQDASEKGFDSYEEYQYALEDIDTEFFDEYGRDAVKDAAVTEIARNFFNNHGGVKMFNSNEAAGIIGYYRDKFDEYEQEGTNSETVANSSLTANSSYEVYDVRKTEDGNHELTVDKEQLNQWLHSVEMDSVKEGFAEFASREKNPYV